jgi:hypothetical protein
MPQVTIYRNQFPDTFTPPTNSWTTYSGGSNHYAGLPAGYLPFWYAGEAIKVATPGLMEVSGSIGGGTSSPHTVGGAQFYGVGVDDPLGQLITDDNTWAYDQRGVTVEVSYVFETSAFNTGAEAGAYFPLIVLAKDLFDDVFMLSVYGDDNGSNSRKLEIARRRWPQSTYGLVSRYTIPGASVTPDDLTHRIKLVAVPGTITVTGGLDVLDGYSVASDGHWHAYIDGVLVAEETGIPLYFGFSDNSGYAGNPVMVRSVWLGFAGLIGAASDLHIYRGTDTTPLVDNSTPCCDTPAAGGGGGTAGNVLGPPDTAPLPEWTPRCAGGGTYPAGTPVTHSEDWRELTAKGAVPNVWLEVDVTPLEEPT